LPDKEKMTDEHYNITEARIAKLKNNLHLSLVDDLPKKK